MKYFKVTLNISKELDKYIAILGVIFSAVLILYLMMTKDRPIFLITGILSFISCTIWCCLRNKVSLDSDFPKLAHMNFILPSIYFFLFAYSIMSVYYRGNLYERPLIYFIFTALMAGTVGLEIIFCKENQKYLILAQIVIIGLSIAWSQLLIFPSLLGIDPWWHQMFALKIMDLFHIPKGYDYSKLPIFHLYIVCSSLINGLNYKYATMFSVSIVQIICNVLFIYMLGSTFFNYRIGLLSSLMVIIANYHIYMSYWSIPNALAIVFIPIILYLLFKVRRKKPVCATVLAIFIMVTLILTHTISAMCIAIILFISWIASSLYKKVYYKIEIPVSLTISILFIVAMLAWWTYGSGSITTLGTLIKWGFSVDYFAQAPKDIINISTTIPNIEQVFNNLGMFLFFSTSFIGIFYMISRKGNSSSFILAFVGFTPLALAYFSLISGHSIIEERWWYPAELFLAIPLAVTIILFITMNRRKSKLISYIAFVFIVVLTFLMIMSPDANVDNNTFSPNSAVRSSLTLSELQAARTVSKWGLIVKTDMYYANSMAYTYSNFQRFDNEIYNKDLNKLEGNIVLVRNEIVKKPFDIFISAPWRLEYDLNGALDNLAFSKVYDCGTVEGYVKNESKY